MRTRIEPTATALLSDPLDFFFAEHFRQRKLCNLIEELAGGDTADPDLTAEVLGFLSVEMPRHVADEEEDLFPLMRLRCPAEDEIERVLSALAAEHAGDRHLSAIITSGLKRMQTEGLAVSAQAGLREAMIDFARNERRHLALENAVVLPLARRRLTKSDLAELSTSMRARRAGAAGPG